MTDEIELILRSTAGRNKRCGRAMPGGTPVSILQVFVTIEKLVVALGMDRHCRAVVISAAPGAPQSPCQII
jgi:hypothetical protein